MEKKTRKTLIFAAKLAVAVGLLALVVTKVPWRDYTVTVDGREVLCRGFRTTIASANGLLLAVAFVTFLIPLFVLAVRWWYLLRIQRIRLRLWEAVRLTFLGTFFNYVVPGVVSGDLVKAYYVFKHTDRKAAALLSVFVDRAVGLLEFAMLPALAMAYMYAAGANTDRLAVPKVVVPVVLAAAAGALAVLLSAGLRRALRLDRVLRVLPFRRHLEMVAQAANLYRRRIGALAKTLAITFGAQVLTIIGIMLAGFTLAPAVAWYEYFLYVPLVYIIAAVPISPGGVGVTEVLFVTFFASGKTTTAEALAVALVARLFPMVCSLPGLVVALTGPKRPAVGQMQVELGRPPGPGGSPSA